MKIAVVRQRYVASGGAERYLNAVIHELAARGHEIHVFAKAWVGASQGVFHFHRVPVLGGAAFLRALTFALWSRRLLQRSGCELVFSLERTLYQDVYRAGDGCHREWLAQRRRYLGPLKAVTLALNPLHQAILGLERRTFSPQCTGCIIANSHRGKAEIIQHYGFPEDRIVVIHNGVDCKRFQPPDHPPAADEFTLLFVGTGFERKGLDFCVRALALLPQACKLKVAGKGNPAPYLRLARSLGVESRVRFLGYNLDPTAVYAQGDLLVHPAVYEPFANVCLEAMASGLPVVTSRINGAAEIIEPGRNGQVVEEPSDIEALGEAMRHFMDRERWREASRQARETALKHSFSLHINQTLDVLAAVGLEKGRCGTNK